MKVAIIGAGAIGGYVGVKLALAGEDVTFLVRGANLTAIKSNGVKLIMADATIDGIRTEVVIDTGAENSIGNLALQRALARRHDHGTTMLVSVTGQEIEASLGYARKLTIADMSINNLQIAYADGPAFAALDLDKRPALLLGMRDLRSFDRVAIDFATRKVLFDLPREAF